MLRTMKCALPLVLLLLAYADALRVSSIRLRGTSSDNIDGDDENSLYPYTQVQIPNEIMSQFANGIEMMATRCAISTASYYMSEFHDRESKDFMLEFQGYKKSGFKNNDWRQYLEAMIALEAKNMTALLPLRFGEALHNPNKMLSYTYILTPRKVAHQILTIREDVSGEMISDLRCIQSENKEVERFASEWMVRGLDVAQSNRKMTRTSDHDDCTPMRNKNYYECAIYITNIALEIVKLQLEKKSPSSLEFLVRVVSKLEERVAAMDPMDRLLHTSKGPSALLEEIYHNGITQGVQISSTGDTLNSLKIAQDLMALRVILAAEAARILSDLATSSRLYYKMIKDRGGFNRFETTAKPVFTVVDISRLPKFMPQAVDGHVEVGSTQPNESTVELESSDIVLTSSPELQIEENIFEASPDDFGGSPFMM